ncbi:hypothetical protein HME7025_01456 [Aquirufa nivalisilvae]|uniref:Uncharacterized protein n=1 Tax=Aquirufa nivalisilvae TaxID=2516557 RepID=A0A2S2DVL5_9BACT|nr:hypothetical protein HME7025_01456 [Aquirufa nivalisilvae]
MLNVKIVQYKFKKIFKTVLYLELLYQIYN